MLLLDVYEKTLGILGLGRIGRAVARRAQGFAMRVLYHDAIRGRAGAGRGLSGPRYRAPRGGLVTLHVPLLPQTRHYIDERALRLMKPTAHLINAARGPVVNEAALVRALREGWIAGAGLDVSEEEPCVHPGLLECRNAVLAPHIASASQATRLRMATMAVEDALAVLEGRRPAHPVNPALLDA